MGTERGAHPYHSRTAREQALWQLEIAQMQFRSAEVSLRMAEELVRSFDREALNSVAGSNGPIIELTAEPKPKD